MLLTIFRDPYATEKRAEVFQSKAGYYTDYYGPDGNLIRTETYENKSIHFVEDAAENWLSGVKQLNG
jgi:hypothetical protein